MIPGKWFDPNFKFRASDAEGHSYEHFCYAKSIEELENRLKDRNLTVEWIQEYDFNEWKDRAKKATDKAVEAYKKGKRPINFRSDIWAELKWHLFDIFHSKCAYCESKTLPAAWGDVEHFRPKSKVDEDPGHPGYYWLAYDETNLLPSCGPCNQARAKMTHFPVRNAHAHDPQGISAEEPLLLNPYDRKIDPFQHLEFDTMGQALAHGNSPYGESSRTFYHLNRPGLSESRRAALAHVAQDWDLLTIRLSNFEAAYNSLRTTLTMGEREYSAAQLWELDRVRKKRSDFLQAPTNPGQVQQIRPPISP
jgi:hypothetical protein